MCVGGDSVTLLLDFDNLSAAGEKLPSSASFHNEDFKDFRSKSRLSQCLPAQEEFPYSVGGGDLRAAQMLVVVKLLVKKRLIKLHKSS